MTTPPHRLAYVLMAALFSTLLSACLPKNDGEASDAPFFIHDNEVYLDKSHILAVKTELYQPSFKLEGQLLPAESAIISAPTDAHVVTFHVNANDSVKKGQTLATLKPRQYAQADETSFDTLLPDAFMEPIDLNAPFSGRVQHLYRHDASAINAGVALIHLVNDDFMLLKSQLPARLKAHLAVGQQVSFIQQQAEPTTAQSTAQTPTITGQVASITAIANTDTDTTYGHDTLNVTVQLPTHEQPIRQGTVLTGHIDYGDLDVGVLVPHHALAKPSRAVSALSTPPHKPAVPLPAKIWVIRQDGSLNLSDVFVIAYQPDTARFLISGISQDSLIASADLPEHAHGKHVVID